MRKREPLNDAVLTHVGVLVLVDEEMIEARGLLRQGVRMEAEEVFRQEQNVVEVDRAEVFESRLILRVRDGAKIVFRIGRDFERFFGSNAGGFPIADRLQKVGRTERRARYFDFAEDLARQRLLVAAVVNRELRREAESMNLPPQNPNAKGVKRRNFRLFLVDSLRQKARNPLLHFAGRFVGEGNGEDAVRRDPALDQPRDAVSNDASFAGSGARENKERPGKRFDGGRLRGVERHIAPFCKKFRLDSRSCQYINKR